MIFVDRLESRYNGLERSVVAACKEGRAARQCLGRQHVAYRKRLASTRWPLNNTERLLTGICQNGPLLIIERLEFRLRVHG
jgi:hypothetical protein